ncbi:hypothetical protein OMP38_32355 [Cohnella ginsengisoli]|uniref:Uncharacterized protein n=1 Tax=Cohnella ginsengisoli TaxID=425004 RepID=A0A9X4KME3_9BACL|nr:hypothetical protein [Cohnella ginsengisoli]MDG0794999.1 hypothetical protein [Cohnella ginsengisoli]
MNSTGQIVTMPDCSSIFSCSMYFVCIRSYWSSQTPSPLNFWTFGSLEKVKTKSIVWLIRESIWLERNDS